MSTKHDTSTFERLIKGLEAFNENTQDTEIFKIILGRQKEALMKYFIDHNDYSIPGSRTLNSTQNEAVRKALKYKVSVVHGPPGTGKTETIITVIYHITNF